MIGFYVYKSLSLYRVCLETFHINNKKIFCFVNLWPKDVPVNISYQKTVNKIDGYLDAMISPTPVLCIISTDKKLNNKKKKINIIQGEYILILLIKKNLNGKWQFFMWMKNSIYHIGNL